MSHYHVHKCNVYDQRLLGKNRIKFFVIFFSFQIWCLFFVCLLRLRQELDNSIRVIDEQSHRIRELNSIMEHMQRNSTAPATINEGSVFNEHLAHQMDENKRTNVSLNSFFDFIFN